MMTDQKHPYSLKENPQPTTGNRQRRIILIFVTLSILLVCSIILSLSYGKDLSTVLAGLFSYEGFGLVLRKIRIPRTVMAFLVGGSLGVCGVTLQSILRNPLAEPYTLGVSGGASLGITVSTVIQMQNILGAYAYPLMGFAGALVSIIVVYTLSMRRSFNPNSMILFGIVASLVFSSVVFFIFSLLDPDKMQLTLMWLMGDLASLDISLIPFYVPLLLAPAVILFFFGKELDILSLGGEKAHYLGVHPPRAYKILFILTSVLTGLCVSASFFII